MSLHADYWCGRSARHNPPRPFDVICSVSHRHTTFPLSGDSWNKESDGSTGRRRMEQVACKPQHGRARAAERFLDSGVDTHPGLTASYHCLEQPFAPQLIDRDLLTFQCDGNSCRARFKINSPNGPTLSFFQAVDTTSLGALKLKPLDRRHCLPRVYSPWGKCRPNNRSTTVACASITAGLIPVRTCSVVVP